MATRKEIDQQTAAVQQFIRMKCASGHWAPGALMPSIRQIAEQHGANVYAVRRAVKNLVDEGVLCTVPRSGIFVSRAFTSEYYMLIGSHSSQFQLVLRGFEDRVAQLGGACVATSDCEILKKWKEQGATGLSGIFHYSILTKDIPFLNEYSKEVPIVRFRDINHYEGRYDTVSFDDIGGGRLATQHLLQCGHERIGFLGLHVPPEEGDGELHHPLWSAEREQGWRMALENAGVSPAGLAIHPKEPPIPWDIPNNRQVAGEVAHKFLLRRDITALVTTNDIVADAVLQGLKEVGVPPAHWPAIVSFDNDPHIDRNVVTSLRLPLEDIGRAAADVLWERRHGQIKEETTNRTVPMRLIPRLTSQHMMRPNAEERSFLAALVS